MKHIVLSGMLVALALIAAGASAGAEGGAAPAANAAAAPVVITTSCRVECTRPGQSVSSVECRRATPDQCASVNRTGADAASCRAELILTNWCTSRSAR